MHGGTLPAPTSTSRAAHVRPKTVFLNRNTQTLNNRTSRMKAFNFEPGRVFNADLHGEEHAIDDRHAPSQEDVILGNDPAHQYVPLPSVFSDIDSESCWPGPAGDDRSLLGDDALAGDDDEAHQWEPGHALTIVKCRKKKGSAAAAVSRGENSAGPSSERASKNKTSANKNGAKHDGSQGRTARGVSAKKKSADDVVACQKPYNSDDASASGAVSEADPALSSNQNNTSNVSPNAKEDSGNVSGSSDSDDITASAEADKTDDTLAAANGSSKRGWGAKPVPMPGAGFSLDPLTFPGLPSPVALRGKAPRRNRNREVDWSTVRSSPGVQPVLRRNGVGDANGKAAAEGAPKNNRAPAGCWGRGSAGRGGVGTGVQPANAWGRSPALGMRGNGPEAGTPGGHSTGVRGGHDNGNAEPQTTTRRRPEHQRKEFNVWDQIVPPENQFQLTEYRGVIERGDSRGKGTAAQNRNAKGKPGTSHNSSGRGADGPAGRGRGNGRVASEDNARVAAGSSNPWKDGRSSAHGAWGKGFRAATADGTRAAGGEKPNDDAQNQKTKQDKQEHHPTNNRFPAAPATSMLPPRKPSSTMLVQARPVEGTTNKLKYVQESMARRVPGCPEWDRAATHAGIQLTAREMEMLNDTATEMQSWDDADDVRIRRLPRPLAQQQAGAPQQRQPQTEAATTSGTAAIARHEAQVAMMETERGANEGTTSKANSGEDATAQRGTDDMEPVTALSTSVPTQGKMPTQNNDNKQMTDTVSQEETPPQDDEKKEPAMWLSAVTKMKDPSQPQDVRCLPNYVGAASASCRAGSNVPGKRQVRINMGAGGSVGPIKMPPERKLKGADDSEVASKPHNSNPSLEQGRYGEHTAKDTANDKKGGSDVALNHVKPMAKDNGWRASSTPVAETGATPDAGCTDGGGSLPTGEGSNALTSHSAANPPDKQAVDLPDWDDDDDDWAAGEDDNSSAPAVCIGTKSTVVAPPDTAVLAYNMVRGFAQTADRPAAGGKRVAAAARGKRDEGRACAPGGLVDVPMKQFVNGQSDMSDMDFGVVLENQSWGSENDL